MMASRRRKPIPEDTEDEYLQIEGIRVDKKILTTPYTCDPLLYGCQSQCCYRGCILNQAEIDKIILHLPRIASYLPAEKRGALLAGDSFVADCASQCPQGCEIHGVEWEAMRLHFPEGESPHCLSYPNHMCLFAYEKKGVRLCSLHAYALEAGMDLVEIKPLDCIQYPLYLGEDEEGRILGIQGTPYLSHIPCLNDPRGEPMVLSLGYAIEALSGRSFYQKLLRFFPE